MNYRVREYELSNCTMFASVDEAHQLCASTWVVGLNVDATINNKINNLDSYNYLSCL